MKQCWRWYGPNDPVDLHLLHMAGVEGIVTSLHDLPPGARWAPERVAERKALIEAAGFTWDVVESLPVSEAIKTGGTLAKQHIAAYKDSLAALAQESVRTICYNFMPILDWTRTSLRTPQPHGGTAMSFDLVAFAAFDLFLLERPDATADYSGEILDAAEAHRRNLTADEAKNLTQTIIMGLPGANDGWSLDEVRELLKTYDDIGEADLRGNLIAFLREVAPVAEDLGLRLCCHPDDPPWPLLGLPRVMSSLQHYATVLQAVDSPANGATFCTGSLGVAQDFDPVGFIAQLGSRIHFAHLRNTSRTSSLEPDRPNFFEAAHLEGDTDMAATVAALIAEERRRRSDGREDSVIPMRPDHGQELLGDRGGHSLPGYPLIGRLRGLAELRGLMAAHEGICGKR
jgi:mannonate dehydratase